MPTSVVTGGAGFLGSHLCDYLVAKGTASSASTTSRRGRFRTSSTCAATRSRSVHHDMIGAHRDRRGRSTSSSISRAPRARSTTCGCRSQTLKVGSYGTHNALGLAKWKRARFLLASTSEVYGDPQVHPQPETYWGNVNPIGPRGVYDEAKRYAEALTMAYHRQQGVDTCIVRIFNTYGPRMRPNDGRAIPTFFRQALAGKPLTVFGDGSQTRSFCYVDDLDSRSRTCSPTSGEHLPVNIGNPTGADAARAGGDRASASPARRARSSSRRCPSTIPQVRQPDITRARQVLGWEPRDRSRGGAAPIAATTQRESLSV